MPPVRGRGSPLCSEFGFTESNHPGSLVSRLLWKGFKSRHPPDLQGKIGLQRHVRTSYVSYWLRWKERWRVIGPCLVVALLHLGKLYSDASIGPERASELERALGCGRQLKVCSNDEADVNLAMRASKRLDVVLRNTEQPG